MELQVRSGWRLACLHQLLFVSNMTFIGCECVRKHGNDSMTNKDKYNKMH